MRAAVVGSNWRRAKAAGESVWATEGAVRVRSRVSSLGGVVMDTEPQGKSRAGQGHGLKKPAAQVTASSFLRKYRCSIPGAFHRGSTLVSWRQDQRE